METPKNIEEYQGDYQVEAWQQYSEDEYHQWVILLTKRAGHRSNKEKKLKDLTDARNYLEMWMATVVG